MNIKRKGRKKRKGYFCCCSSLDSRFFLALFLEDQQRAAITVISEHLCTNNGNKEGESESKETNKMKEVIFKW